MTVTVTADMVMSLDGYIAGTSGSRRPARSSWDG